MTHEAVAPLTVASIIELSAQSVDALNSYLAQLSEEQISGLRNRDGWSVKDHVAHLAVWMNSLNALLRREPRWVAMGVGDVRGPAGSINEVNAVLRDRYAEASLHDVRAMLHAAYEQVRDQLSRLDDAALLQPYAVYQPEEQSDNRAEPVWQKIVGNTYEHIDQHVEWMHQIVAPASQ